MNIDAIKLALPSKKVTNDDILSMIERESAEGFKGDLEGTLKEISYFLKYSGSNTRYWLDEGETPISLLKDASERALLQANLDKSDIDVLVYVGIGRGFLEPGGAYHAAKALGMYDVECYDIIDACMSWTRAMQQLQALFSQGVYKKALVVNAECNMIKDACIYPGVFKLGSQEDVESRFPAFTLGEGATATIVSADDGPNENLWEFHFLSRSDWSDLCNIPMKHYEGFCLPTEKTGKNGAGLFTSFGSKLHEYGRDSIVRTMDKMLSHTDVKGIKAIFTHASSKRDWDNFADDLNLKHLLYPIYPETGNLVSASVPAAIAKALESGTVCKGDQVLGWVGSAGMSFCTYKFRL